MRKRFGVVEADGPGLILVKAGPKLKPDFLATLLDCGMPDVPDRVFVLVKSPPIVKLCGPEYEGFELCYFGILKEKCDIDTGVSFIRGETQEGSNFEMTVWARAVSWGGAWAYFLNFYDAKSKYWRMHIGRIEMDKALMREKIGHKLVDGMRLALMQFEGFVEAAGKREDDISVKNFRPYCFKIIKAFANKHAKLNIRNLAVFMDLNRDTVSKYMARDPSLMDDLRAAFVLHRNSEL